MSFDTTIALASIAEVKDFLKKTDDTDLAILDVLSNGVAAFFKSYSGRTFIKPGAAVTVKLDGTGRTDLWTPDWPVASITSLKEGGYTLTADTDYYLYDTTGRLRRMPNGAVWTEEPRNVELVYLAGYAATAVPADLKMAFMAQIAALWKKHKTQAWGETNRSLASQSVAFAENDILPLTITVLDRYRRKRP
jgi:hypothetical protein